MTTQTHDSCPKCWQCPDCDARWCIEWCDYSHMCGQDNLDSQGTDPGDATTTQPRTMSTYATHREPSRPTFNAGDRKGYLLLSEVECGTVTREFDGALRRPRVMAIEEDKMVHSYWAVVSHHPRHCPRATIDGTR